MKSFMLKGYWLCLVFFMSLSFKGYAADVEAVIKHSNSCLGNGSITLKTNRGFPPFEYSWTGPNGFASTTQNITNLREGVYRVTVTDFICATAVGVYEVRKVPRAYFTNRKNVSDCATGICDGSLTLTPLGNGPFTYSWRGPNGYTNAQSGSISGLCPGNYTVTVTYPDACTETFEANSLLCFSHSLFNLVCRDANSFPAHYCLQNLPRPLRIRVPRIGSDGCQ